MPILKDIMFANKITGLLQRWGQLMQTNLSVFLMD